MICIISNRVDILLILWYYDCILKERGNYMANAKQTSKSVASKASSILRDNRYSPKSKSVAGSALSQTKTTGKKK